MITTQECRKLIKEAIKKFGEYNYFDKGPDEVMDMNSIMSRMKDMNGEQILSLLEEIVTDEYGAEFVRTCLVDLQDREDLDNMYNSLSKALQELY